MRCLHLDHVHSRLPERPAGDCRKVCGAAVTENGHARGIVRHGKAQDAGEVRLGAASLGLDMPKEYAISDGRVRTKIFHSDLIQGESNFRHVDATLLIYSSESYQRRLDGFAFRDKVKAEGHFKLFWIGECALSAWADLIQLAFPRNELIHEYLTGTRFSVKDYFAT